jgi:hypothetical protein
MFNKKNILKYAPYPSVISNIFPAKQNIPDWYKNGIRISNLNDNKEITELPVRAGFKLCTPFLEALTSGYMIPLHTDIAIKQTDGGPSITFSNELPTPVELRDTSVNPTLPTPSGMSDLHFAWQTAFAIEIPKGYSALITHPLNRYDLPFITLSGILDGEYAMPRGNLPVFFSSSFEGIIKEGTPIAQIFLFKQEDWLSKVDESILEKAKFNHVKCIINSFGYYKKHFWKKKSYQ